MKLIDLLWDAKSKWNCCLVKTRKKIRLHNVSVVLTQHSHLSVFADEKLIPQTLAQYFGYLRSCRFSLCCSATWKMYGKSSGKLCGMLFDKFGVWECIDMQQGKRFMPPINNFTQKHKYSSIKCQIIKCLAANHNMRDMMLHAVL